MPVGYCSHVIRGTAGTPASVHWHAACGRHAASVGHAPSAGHAGGNATRWPPSAAQGLSCDAVLRSHCLASDEINHLAVNRQGTWLAAADDSGEVVLLDLQQVQRDSSCGGSSSAAPAYKTLRRGHTNICSAVAFRAHR